MADARALLRGKRQEARVSHPLASYSASGQLRCIACGTIVKLASSWEGHIGSKSHRTNVARLREEERRREEEETLRHKRKTEELDGDQDEEDEAPPKRQRLDDETGADASQAPQPAQAGNLPVDFFSDPSQAPPPSDEGEDEAAPAAAAPPDHPPSAIDLEWQLFQQAVINAPDAQATYAHATIAAEPVLVTETPEGFPPIGTEDTEPEQVVDEAELRRRKEKEERELIMDRLLEEERAQEEADAKVTELKSKLEALKNRRNAKRAAKQAQGTS